ncbi:hypothetical protein ABG067_007948, partial [Albugo candida]
MKKDFSSEYREAQHKKNEILNRNSEREYRLGMMNILMEGMKSNAFGTTSWEQSARILKSCSEIFADDRQDQSNSAPSEGLAFETGG